MCGGGGLGSSGLRVDGLAGNGLAGDVPACYFPVPSVCLVCDTLLVDYLASEALPGDDDAAGICDSRGNVRLGSREKWLLVVIYYQFDAKERVFGWRG